MKKYFLLAAAAATVLAVSCNKEKNQPTTDPTPNVVDEIDDTTPQPVRLGVSNAVVKSSVSTKAAIDQWAQQDLYIFGIQVSGKIPSAAVSPTGQIFINNVKATAPDATAAAHQEIDVIRTGNEKFYYGMNDEVYNFYGYYVADAYAGSWDETTNPAAPTYSVNGTVAAAAPVVTVPDALEPDDDAAAPSPGTYTLGVEINGTQDIMLATTDKDADFSRGYAANGNKYVPLTSIYSAKAARRQIHPDLIFEHQLSRFVFQLKAGNDATKDNMTITSIAIDSKHTATLDITKGETTFDGTTVPFKQPTTEALTDAFSAIFADIMVAPGEASYNVTIDYTYNGITAPIQPIKTTVNLATLLDEPTYKAEAGKKYLVQIVVYGPEEIKIFVTLVPWDLVNLDAIDPDEDFEDDRTAAAITVTEPAAIAAAQIELYPGTAQITATSTNTLTALTYTSSNEAKATVDNTGKVTLTNAAAVGDTFTITVSQAAGVTHLAATDVVVNYTVVDSRTATQFAGIPDAAAINENGGAYTIEGVKVQAGGVDLEPMPTISYAITAGDSFASIDGNVVTATANGEVTITATYAGDATYKPVTAQFTIAITGQS